MTTKMTRTAWGLDHLGDDWRSAARCNLATAHLFDVLATRTTRTDNPPLTADNRAALDLCAACPVDKQRCLDDALANGHPNMWTIAAGRLVYGGRVVDTSQPSTVKPRVPDLAARVAALHRQGRSPAAIARVLNVSAPQTARAKGLALLKAAAEQEAKD